MITRTHEFLDISLRLVITKEKFIFELGFFPICVPIPRNFDGKIRIFDHSHNLICIFEHLIAIFCPKGKIIFKQALFPIFEPIIRHFWWQNYNFWPLAQFNMNFKISNYDFSSRRKVISKLALLSVLVSIIRYFVDKIRIFDHSRNLICISEYHEGKIF